MQCICNAYARIYIFLCTAYAPHNENLQKTFNCKALAILPISAKRYFLNIFPCEVAKCKPMVYNISMITSFKHKGLEAFFKTGSTKGIQAIHANKLRILLAVLNTMTSTDDLSSKALRFHKLQGKMKDLYSITVQANWRITFKFDEKTKDVYVVDYQDYH